jgi:hypothetical protein
MSDPHTEQAYEYFEDNKEEIFEEWIASGKPSDTELLNVIMDNPKLFNLLCEEWCKDSKREGKLIDWYMHTLPDGNEDDPREDR